MKITRQKLRQLIKEEYIKEIYGDGHNDLGMVPPSGEPTSSDKDFYRYYNVQGKTPQSFQPKEVQEIVKLFCPSGGSNEDNNMMAIDLYNDLSNTTLSLSTSGDNIFIEGSLDDMKKKADAAKVYFETIVREYFEDPTLYFLNWLEKKNETKK